MQNVQKVLRRWRETERERGRHTNDCFLVIERERENKMAQRLYLNPG